MYESALRHNEKNQQVARFKSKFLGSMSDYSSENSLLDYFIPTSKPLRPHKKIPFRGFSFCVTYWMLLKRKLAELN